MAVDSVEKPMRRPIACLSRLPRPSGRGGERRRRSLVGVRHRQARPVLQAEASDRSRVGDVSADHLVVAECTSSPAEDRDDDRRRDGEIVSAPPV